MDSESSLRLTGRQRHSYICTSTTKVSFSTICNSEDKRVNMETNVLVRRLSHKFEESLVDDLALSEAFQKLGYDHISKDQALAWYLEVNSSACY